MFSSFFRSKKWVFWAYGGLFVIIVSLILKNCENPRSWKTSYTFGWISRRMMSPPFGFTIFKNAVNEPIPVDET